MEQIEVNKRVQQIVDLVAHYFGITSKQLVSRKRTDGIKVPRQVAMYIAYYTLIPSVTQIGRYFGKGHSTVRDSIDVIENYPKIHVHVAYLKETIAKQMMDDTWYYAKHYKAREARQLSKVSGSGACSPDSLSPKTIIKEHRI